MNRRLLLLIGAAGGIILVLAIWVWVTGPAVMGPVVRAQKLPDGSVMILRGVTYGRAHRLATGNLFQRSAARLLPETLATRLGIRFLTYSNAVPSLMVWVEHDRQTTTRRPKGGYMATPIIVADDAGTEFEQNGSGISSQGTNSLVEGFGFSAFPSASRMVSIRVRPFDYVKRTSYEARFRVPNPAFAPGVPAAPTTYPVRVTQDDLTFILKAFSPREGPLSSRGSPLHEKWMSTEYQILDHRNPTNDWFAHNISVRNSTGGEYSPSAISGIGETARTNLAFRGGLGTNAAWTLRYGLVRASFGSNEVHTFQRVPIPGRSDHQFAPASATLQGVTLTLIGFRIGSYVFAGFSPPDKDLRLELVRIVDDRGREGHVTVTGVEDGANYQFGTDLPPDATTADLTFALRRERHIEVTARPTPKP
jgi:hypothetical protein